jgi:hypothetical protein
MFHFNKSVKIIKILLPKKILIESSKINVWDLLIIINYLAITK